MRCFIPGLCERWSEVDGRDLCGAKTWFLRRLTKIGLGLFGTKLSPSNLLAACAQRPELSPSLRTQCAPRSLLERPDSRGRTQIAPAASWNGNYRESIHRALEDVLGEVGNGDVPVEPSEALGVGVAQPAKERFEKLRQDAPIETPERAASRCQYEAVDERSGLHEPQRRSPVRLFDKARHVARLPSSLRGGHDPAVLRIGPFRRHAQEHDAVFVGVGHNGGLCECCTKGPFFRYVVIRWQDQEVSQRIAVNQHVEQR